MIPRHDFLSNLPTKRPSWFPVMTFYQTFLPNGLHVSPSWLSIIALYQTAFMFSLHGSLPWLPTKRPSCSPSWLPTMASYQTAFMFPVMTPYQMQKGNAKRQCKKIMQKSGKISILSSLDAKLEFLTSRVELTRFLVKSSHVELKICSTRLESNWKC